MTTVATGNRAERAAALYLRERGYLIIDLNFRRPYCEIDIVAMQADTVYFVEVKYRRTALYGDGLEYITAEKLRHMRRAAGAWVAEHRYQGEYSLAAISVTGSDFEILDFIESLG